MYSQKIIQRRIDAYERDTGKRLRVIPIDRARSITHYLEGKLNIKGERVRPSLTSEFAAFIENERAMCKASFLYWAERYAFIEYRIGHGGTDLFKPLESQYLLLEKMAAAEEENWARKDAGDLKFLGICFMIHKARQLGFTTLCQLLLQHLELFYSETKGLSASVDDQKTIDMHTKWDMVYSRLPYWQKVVITSQEKDRGKWLANGSYAALQDFAQKGGLGQGNTWTALHLTELSSVDDEYLKRQVDNNLLPALADTLRVIAFMESTSQTAGNWWHQRWLQVDSGRGGRWRPAFIPSYAEPGRWSRPFVPEGWEPNDETKKYAEMVVRTSPKYMNGRTVRPSREHLLWWEEERQIAIDTGTLHLFLANYCATPEESFQYAEGGAFGPVILQAIENRVDCPAVAYELVDTPAKREAVRGRMRTEKDAPRVISAGSIDLVPIHTTERDEKDPRGIVLLFEPPRLDVVYSGGADPAVGIAGWNRIFRNDTQEELNRDNSCASGWYRDPKTGLILQAFEFAGPYSPRDFAKYLYALGKAYSGANGPERGLSWIIETNNGGVEVQNVMMNDYRYYSMWQRTKSDGVKTKQLDAWGFVTTQQSKQELWVYAKDIIEQPAMPVRPRSHFLFHEMHLARWDPLKRTGAVPEGNGQHDDRIMAMLLALWQLRTFMPVGSYGELAKSIASASKRSGIDFQQMDIATMDEYNDAVDTWYERVNRGW